MNLWPCLALLLQFAITANANTEKIVFSAPPTSSIPDAGPSFNNLDLYSLSPERLSVRLALPVAFPEDPLPKGLDSWYLLESLHPGQRYEVRICWAAIQPTAFTIDTFEPQQVFDTPHLITSLAAYSEAHALPASAKIKPRTPGSQQSLLFLRVQSAADYYTTNETLMLHPPLVDVDIILDPYLGNIFPQSLLPTGVYIIVLAAGSWWLSGAIWKRLFSAPKQHTD
ncbi:hypothetical protein B0A50_06952 [Salinomyces thailandicus]|uniref:Uncharacterized protein n=1 Tax=Salinomyces thailandicus TaxID=706561 RepID=A0A4U0TPQ1_9PEZI|nr:hypothetical protein B0A50_06952 [Salinomyces thailandica]